MNPLDMSKLRVNNKFGKRMINGMKSYQETNYQKLLDAIGPSVVLTDAELKSLMWLAG